MTSLLQRIGAAASQAKRASPALIRKPLPHKTITANYIRPHIGPPYGRAYLENDLEYAVDELREMVPATEKKLKAEIEQLESRVHDLELAARRRVPNYLKAQAAAVEDKGKGEGSSGTGGTKDGAQLVVQASHYVGGKVQRAGNPVVVPSSKKRADMQAVCMMMKAGWGEARKWP